MADITSSLGSLYFHFINQEGIFETSFLLLFKKLAGHVKISARDATASFIRPKHAIKKLKTIESV
jgi:hypothetical protein